MKIFLEEEGQKRKERTLTNKTQSQNPKKGRKKNESEARKLEKKKQSLEKKIEMDKKKNGKKK